MKYRLYENEINSDNVLEKVLWNRGIKDYKKYLSLDKSVEISYNKLNNITNAVEVFMKHYENNDKIAVLVDSDPDGYTSAATMYLYIKRLNKDYPVCYIMHKDAKAHGLSKDVVIPEGTKLLILPDAGTNDYEQCKKLLEDNIVEDIIILDHHEAEENGLKNNSLDNVTIVNNQMSEEYTNKDLSGVGIVYKFLKALDEATWNEYADDYLDLVALGNISDVMNMTSFETRYLVNEGLKNINNKFFKAIVDAQEFSMKGKVNIHNVQWCVTPVLNGMIRVGSDEEKELLFRAMIEQDEFFEYKKRATKDKPAEVIQESIYDRAARLSKNAKSRQDKVRDKVVEEISKLINNTYNEDNKVLIVDVTDILDNKGLTGVLAIKIAEMYNKPCILLKKFVNDKNEIVYGGSARNVDNSPIESFKDVVNKTGSFLMAQGHSSAFGANIELDKVDEANDRFNELLKDVEYDATYIVDYIFEDYELDPSFPIEMVQFNDIVAQGVSEPLIAVENITITRNDISLVGKTSNTLKFTLPNGIEFVQFYCKNGMTLYDWANETWDTSDSITINVVGQPGVNEFMGTRTPQIVIKDAEIIESNKSESFDDDEDIW
jgi:single-stranded-DNA-specific exonuclease